MTIKSSEDEGAEVLGRLDDGLLIRRGTAADAAALSDLAGQAFRDPETQETEVHVQVWTYDLVAGRHPHVTARDFTIVEDAATGRPVSAMCLIPQTWSYAGVPFAVGRPELVMTDPAYRDRGLVRAQFEIIHRWSAAQDYLLQGITGIPYFYRLFGYEYAAELGGGRSGPAAGVPRLRDGETEPFRVRPATEADLPLVMELDANYNGRSLLACERDADLWRYEIAGRGPQGGNGRAVCIIERAGGAPVGFMVHYLVLWRGSLTATTIELLPGISWLGVAPSLARYLLAAGSAIAESSRVPFDGVAIGVISGHPIYEAVREWLPHVGKPYAWYLRVPDLPRFLRHILPVLEARLAASPAAGHTGQLLISFYRSGLRLEFIEGRITAVEPWRPSHAWRIPATFPGQTFLQLLFGYRDLDELLYAYPDCGVDGDVPRVLLSALFPRQPSHIWPIE